MTKSENRWYDLGRDARELQLPRSTCPYGFADQAIAHAWWNAGYSDADTERASLAHRYLEEQEIDYSTY